MVSSKGDKLNVLNLATGETVTLAHGRVLSDPSWSPDGRTIAFVADYVDIWIIGDDGSDMRCVTDYGSSSMVGVPSWSTDGRKLVFSVSQDPTQSRTGEIHIVDLDGPIVESLTQVGADYAPVRWSPAGDMLAFSVCEDRGCYIWVMKPDGSEQTELARGILYDWSPDGDRIYFGVTEDDYLWMMNKDGSGRTQLFRLACENPAWSPATSE